MLRQKLVVLKSRRGSSSIDMYTTGYKMVPSSRGFTALCLRKERDRLLAQPYPGTPGQKCRFSRSLRSARPARLPRASTQHVARLAPRSDEKKWQKKCFLVLGCLCS